MDLARVIRENLVHYNRWTDVEIHELVSDDPFLSGVPPNKLDEHDTENQTEWVLPRLMSAHEHVSPKELAAAFAAIAEVAERPRRITLAIASDDGLVVYYFVHDGVVKPRQN